MKPDEYRRSIDKISLEKARQSVIEGLDYLECIDEDEHVGAAIQSLQDARVMIGAALENLP